MNASRFHFDDEERVIHHNQPDGPHLGGQEIRGEANDIRLMQTSRDWTPLRSASARACSGVGAVHCRIGGVVGSARRRHVTSPRVAIASTSVAKLWTGKPSGVC